MTRPLPPDFNPHDDIAALRAERERQYTYTPLQRVVQRTRALFRAAIVYFFGYDISFWQSQVVFPVAKNQGLLYVFIRALYGLSVDTKFAQHWTQSKGVKPRGAYLYYKDDLDPIAQAQKLYDTCLANGDLGELPPVVDVETKNNATLTASKIKLCVDEVNALFGDVMIYTGFYVWRDSVKGEKSWASQYKLWIAGYPFSDWKDEYFETVKNYPPLIPAPWLTFDVWQFTSKIPAAPYGISGNTFDGDYCTPGFAVKYNIGQPPPEGETDLIIHIAKCLKPGLSLRLEPTQDGLKVGSLTTNQELLFFPELTVTNGPDDKWFVFPNAVPGYKKVYAAAEHPTLNGSGLQDLGVWTA